MKSALNIIFNTKKGLKTLDNEFEDDLFRKGILIYIILGLVSHIFENGIPKQNFSYWYLFELIIGILISILFGLIGSFILYRIGKWINGKASSIEIFSLLSYANIPIIIGLLVVWILRNPNLTELSMNNGNIRNIILYVSWIIYLKILILGMIKFNKYSLKKGLINILPIILVNVIFLLLYFTRIL